MSSPPNPLPSGRSVAAVARLASVAQQNALEVGNEVIGVVVTHEERLDVASTLSLAVSEHTSP